MKLVLFRHAERANSGENNPPLSARGHKQATQLADSVHRQKLPSPTELWVTPRVRSQQTLLPLAKLLSLELTLMTDLDERQSQETAVHFKTRVEQLLRRAEMATGTLYLCSHLDWIEEALLLIPSDSDLLHARYQSWAPGSYMHFQVDDGLWHLQDFGGLKC